MREEIEGAGKICCRFGMAFLDACLVNEKTKKKKKNKKKKKRRKKKKKKKSLSLMLEYSIINLFPLSLDSLRYQISLLSGFAIWDDVIFSLD